MIYYGNNSLTASTQFIQESISTLLDRSAATTQQKRDSAKYVVSKYLIALMEIISQYGELSTRIVDNPDLKDDNANKDYNLHREQIKKR